MNEDNLNLNSQYYRALINKESDPDKTIALLRQVRKLAELSGNDTLVLSCDNSICDALTFYANRPIEALHIAIQASIMSKQVNCSPQIKATSFRCVLDSYLYCDPIGYEDDIRKTIDYIEQELNPALDLWRLMQWARAYLELALLDLDRALEEGLEYLQRSGNTHYRLADSYSFLCEAHYHRQENDKILEMAILGEEHSKHEIYSTKRWFIEFKAWQAYCYLTNGDKELAHQAYQNCTFTWSQIQAKPYPALYDALCAYYVLNNEVQKAVHLRDGQLQDALDSKSPYRITECRLRRCQLFKQMGQSFEEESELAKQDAKRLVKPESYLKRLNEI